MSRLRFSIAQLMALVFYVGFAFAALRNANAYWASATFDLAIVSVSVALAGACARTPKARMSWAGFAAAGGAYLIIWLFAPLPPGSLYGRPQPLLYQFQSSINPIASGGAAYIAYTQICNSLDVILVGLAGAAVAHLVAPRAPGADNSPP